MLHTFRRESGMLKVRKGERVKCWIFFFTNKLLATIYMQGYNNKDYCLLWLPMIFFSSFLFSFYNFVTGKSFLVYGWHERSCRELLFDIKLQHISKDMLLNFMTMMMRMRMLLADGFSLLCVSYKLFNFPGRHHIYILQHIRMWNETEWSERVSVLFCCRFVSAGVTEIIAIISHEVYIGCTGTNVLLLLLLLPLPLQYNGGFSPGLYVSNNIYDKAIYVCILLLTAVICFGSGPFGDTWPPPSKERLAIFSSQCFFFCISASWYDGRHSDVPLELLSPAMISKYVKDFGLYLCDMNCLAIDQKDIK